MSKAFIIMQIGNIKLDQIYTDVMLPAIIACGLDPKRVDKHNEGGLLKSEIIKLIQESDILIADITNERPNVYLEIGYAMGIDKFRNLILTAREDHFPESPNYAKGGQKVHFDLAGYDILRWNPTDLAAFRITLEKKIRHRLALITASRTKDETIWDSDWVKEQRDIANSGIKDMQLSAFMEIRAALHEPKITKTQTELMEAARTAPINVDGWPFAVFLTNADSRPRPRADGIFAEISSTMMGRSYDYWSIRRNGDFFYEGSLFEDRRPSREILFNYRISKVTEALLYLLRLYSNLSVDRSSRLSIGISHGGLRDRTIVGSGLFSLHVPRISKEDYCSEETSGTIDEFESELVVKVEKLLSPLFILFDFLSFDHALYDGIVNEVIKKAGATRT